MESRRSRSRWLFRSLHAAFEQLRFLTLVSVLVLLGPTLGIKALVTGTGRSWALPLLVVTVMPAVYVIAAVVAVPLRPVQGTERAIRAVAGERARRLLRSVRKPADS
jgi:hypothetical protein